jgi:hypothetical protein
MPTITQKNSAASSAVASADRASGARICECGDSTVSAAVTPIGGPDVIDRLVEIVSKKNAVDTDTFFEILSNVLMVVIELRDDRADDRACIVDIYKRINSNPPKKPARAGEVTLKQAAGVVGYHQENIRTWAVADKKMGRRIGGRWMVKLDRVIEHAERLRSRP